jgi:hypothetical protein
MDLNTTSVNELIELIHITQDNNFDVYSLILSITAVIISIVALYFSYFFKSSKAILSLVKQEDLGNSRKLYYTLSNVGNQELFIRHVLIFLKPINITCLQIPLANINVIEPFIIKPNQIKYFTINEEKYNDTIKEDIYKILNIHILNSFGKRFEINHNITKLKSDTKLKDIIYDGVSLKKLKHEL